MDKLLDAIFSKNKVVVITGAGISTLSGIPDFRGKNGLYKKHVNTEWYLSKECLIEEPDVFYNFYKNNLIIENIKPNIVHETLSKLQEMGYIDYIITQNIDALHKKAGSERVIELHGNGEKFYCSKCKEEYDLNYYVNSGYKCKCNGVIRPDIVLYGEPLKSNNKVLAYKKIMEADVVIVFGSSLSVSTITNLLDEFISVNNKDNLIIVNDNITYYDEYAIKYTDDLDSVFKKIKEYKEVIK